MAFDKKPSKRSQSIASAEDALDKEGPLGRIDHDTFGEQLNDPAIRESLEVARKISKKLYAEDTATPQRSGRRA